MKRVAALKLLHAELDACRACPNVIGPVVHGPPVSSRIVLIGQAPGRHEGDLGRPFAWTAGKTLFKWFESAMGCTEAQFRAAVYMTAVARCFPGKAAGGGDRKPAPDEIERCGHFLSREVQILAPRLLIPVGALAIEQVLGHHGQLASVIGEARRARWHGVEADIVALPHPSGASTWHRREPGKALLQRALELIAAHPEVKHAFHG